MEDKIPPVDCEWIITEAGDGCVYTCKHCKQDPQRFKCGAKLRRTCANEEYTKQKRDLQFGDMAEKLLNHIGVTQERYVEVKAWLMGLPPKEVCSGCSKRKEFLNDLGTKLSKWLGRT